ncbi:MAG TPA: hypothetical protein VG125_20485 [Pirellulales bacterium]|jgi:hypothetical protein|nr:hypothetical protein [Pirellulales bacterium]
MEENPYKGPVDGARSTFSPQWTMMFLGFGIVTGAAVCVLLLAVGLTSASNAEENRQINETIANEFAIESRRMLSSAVAVLCLLAIACRWIARKLREERSA